MINIIGLQKITLLDYPGKISCIIFLEGCNLRCPFCHNSEIICEANNDKEYISEEYILNFLKNRYGILQGVVITGGEPLLHDISDFIRKIKELNYDIKLDTNGTFPDRLEYLIKEKLIDYIAMDIKNDVPRYNSTSGCKSININNIYKSISIIMNSNIDYEFRTTVLKYVHDNESFYNIGKMIKGASKYYIQPFINRDTVSVKGLSSPDKDELKEFKDIMTNYVSHVGIR